jgi:hypothetical protein
MVMGRCPDDEGIREVVASALFSSVTGGAAWQAAAGPIWDEWAKADPRNQETLTIAKKALGL